MKLIVISILCILSLSCVDKDQRPIQPPNSPPILEMSQELVGMWDIIGELLDFRLYDNGYAEWELVDRSKKSKAVHTTDELKIRKQRLISESELENIVRLVKEVLKLEDLYKAKRTGIDNSLNNSVRVRIENIDKTIKIRAHLENLSNPSPENFPNFPTVLSDLYKEIDKIKSVKNKNPAS